MLIQAKKSLENSLFYYDRGGRYTEEDAKAIVVQILNVVAFCHLQGVVHRDLKPEVLFYGLTISCIIYLLIKLFSCHPPFAFFLTDTNF